MSWTHKFLLILMKQEGTEKNTLYVEILEEMLPP